MRTFVGVFSLLVAVSAMAGEADLPAVVIERVTIIAIQTAGHQTGNMEVKIKNGFTLPSGVVCDKNYITTLKSIDPDRAMLSILLKAQTTAQPLRLRITDNPAYTAYTGRCSIEIVDVY